MKHLRRKRTTSTSSPSPAPASPSSSSAPHTVPAPSPLAPMTPAEPPPLYARFASTTTHGAGTKPVVSGPLALAPRANLRAGPAPVHMQRGPSSQSERERERERERDRAQILREREWEREVVREKSKATLRREDTAADGKRPGPSYSQSHSQREDARERQREMRRVQSRGEALLVAEEHNAGTQTETQTQTQTQAQAQASRAHGERVLLPARMVTRKRVEVDGVSHAEPEPERGKPSGGHGLGERAGADTINQVRVVGERVLLPARKVTKKRVEKASDVHAANVEHERPIPVTSSTSGRTLEDTPRYAQNRYDQDQNQDVSISAPYRLPSPPASTSIPGPSSPSSATRAIVIKVSSEPDGWEDKFSTPKRGHMKGLASPTSPTFITGPGPSSSASPMLGSSRSAWEPSNLSDLSTSASVVTPSSSSSGTNTSSKTALDNQVRVVGDRVLLPARKVTRRNGEARADVEKEQNKDKEKEKESSPERGRTMSINKRPSLSLVRSKHTVDGPLPASTSTQLSSSEGSCPDMTGYLETSGSTSPIRKPTSMSGMPVPPESPTRPDMERAHPWTSASMTSETTSTSTSTKPAAPSATSPSHPSASSNAAETNGRPPRRRKYSLLAAFGLPVSRTASDSESSTPADAKPPTPTPASAPPPAPPAPSATPTPAADVQPGSAVTASVSADDQPRERTASSAGREGQVQLQSLHLSGFSFPLDALLADHSDSDPGQAPPMPIPTPTPANLLAPPSHMLSKRPSIVDSPPHNAPPSDLPLPSVPPARNHSSPKHAATPSSKTQIPYSPSPPPPPVPSLFSLSLSTSADPPARPVWVPSQAQKTKHKTRAIDPDQSVLSPESDTRYPLPSRRSPSAQSSSQARPQKTPTAPAPRPKKTSPSPSSSTRSSPTKMEQSASPANSRGPVQGRPLIFAAMAAAEAEAEIVDPKAWMAVATSDPEDQEDEAKHVQTEHSNGSSQFVNGYPTPRSTSPRLPTSTPHDAREEDRGAPHVVRDPSAEYAREVDARHPSPSIPRSSPTVSGSLPTPPETHSRPRKLSKSRSRVTRSTDPSQPPSQPYAQTQSQSESNGHVPNTLGAKPPTPVDDAPPVRTREGASRSSSAPSSAAAPTSGAAPSSSLGSPFNMRNEKYPVDRRAVDSRSPPRVISSESPVPTRPVKMLTERQMEKLSATKGLPMPPSNATSPQRRPEPPTTVKSPSSRAKQLPSQLPPDELPAVPTSSGHSTRESPPATPEKHTEELPPTTPPRQKTPNAEPQQSPGSPENYVHARSRRRGKALEKDRPEGIEQTTPVTDRPLEIEKPYPLDKHVAQSAMLGQLLVYLSFSDWLALSSTSKAIRTLLQGDRELTERVLGRYLRTVGYAPWSFPETEPLTLTLQDLNAYMHGVSLPQHQFARHAEVWLQTRDRKHRDAVLRLQAACRSYTRVVLRLRAQAEAEARLAAAVARDRARSPGRGWGGSTTSVNHVSNQSPNQYPTPKKSFSRSSSRAPSPTSMFSHSQHGHYGHSHSGSLTSPVLHHNQSHAQFHGPGNGMGMAMGTFQSPLFRLRRAPLLQVFVASQDGDWLSDTSVVECENELKRAGVGHLLRAGDVVWDTAVGDEGNVGRMVWDGSYLIDLEYAYSRSGDLPKYLPTLAFPPSYFHRVVRTMGSGNPICHIDIAPWGEEIATNLQLLQDRMKTETPQGGHHMVVRWVHRSSFTIRPPSGGKPLRISVPKFVGPGPGPGGAWLVDPGWYGTVVVEAEGTNEGLADLQDRCRGAFPIRAMGAAASLSVSPERTAREMERRNVFRILRDKSRPGEIWIRTVTAKERLLPPH